MHGVASIERILLRKGAITVVAVVAVYATGNQNVDKSIVVEIRHFRLQSEATEVESCSNGNIFEVTIAIVFQQGHGCGVVR